MKVVIVLAAALAVIMAAPLDTDKDAVVLKYTNENLGFDGYNFAVETSNGINTQENGQVVNAGSENEAIAVRGQYSYTGPDGVNYVVSYVADENGYQPQGAHIPQA